MRPCQLLARVQTGYIRTGFSRMRELAQYGGWNEGTGEWLVPVERLPAFAAVLGEPLEVLPKQKKAIQDAMKLLGLTLDIEGWKGKSDLVITRFPDYFHIVEHRRHKETGEVQTIETDVPVQNVAALWKVMLAYPLSKWVRWETVAENVCDFLGVADRFRRETGSFDKAKFFGNRTDYMMFYYYPTKVLESMEVIVYGHGRLMRVSDLWDVQARISGAGIDELSVWEEA